MKKAFKSIDWFAIIGSIAIFACLAIGAVITHKVIEAPAPTHEAGAVVEEVNSTTGEIVAVDWSGEAWVFEGEGLKVGDPVILVFCDMGTETIYDDEIIQVIFEKGA